MVMNANELNKWIENSPYTDQEELVVLLRQLQDQIAELKYQLDITRAVLKKAQE